MIQPLSRRHFLTTATAGALVAGGMVATPAIAAPSSTNGIHSVYVSAVTVNSTNKQVTVAVGPTTAGTTVPAGSTWVYTVNVWAQFEKEGVNRPTTSRANSVGSWSTPRLVARDGAKSTFELRWTSKVPLRTTSRGPSFQWTNSQNPLRPGSEIQVISTAPDGTVTDQYIDPNQRRGTYYF